ncbi:MAG: DoxX-like family protein [Bacteroidota bacterium]
MINRASVYKIINFAIAAVWLINGLFCKVLNLVPRHRLIVAEILGEAHATLLTTLIGVSEVLMSVWILSAIKPKYAALATITLVLLMNILEFILAPGLLLFGRLNALVAVAFAFLVYYNKFHINKPAGAVH